MIPLAQHFDAQLDRGRRGARIRVRARAAIDQGLTRARPRDPLADGRVGRLHRLSHGAGRLAELAYAPHRFLSTSHGKWGIVVDVHPSLLRGASGCLATSRFPEKARMNNLPATNLARLHT